MALLAADVRAGDEVIVPALTWIATANAAAILGAKVILADCYPDSPLVNIDEVKNKITSRTRAIIPVHLNGRACPMGDLKELIRGKDIALIEDTCKAMNSKTLDGCLGTLGDMGCFSLGMISLISTGYGGLVITRRKDLYEKLLLIRNQGVPYQGDEEYLTVSSNFKLSDILAAIGLGQISRLDEKMAHLDKLYKLYLSGISSLSVLQIIPVDTATGKVPLCVEVRSKHREEIIEYLAKRGVEALRFHLPLHRAAYLGDDGDYPNASCFADEGFILPCGPSQPVENVEKCIDLLWEFEQRYH
jgi:dTDP-4-amino-4,6-dideoxygalactose transaminase